MMRDGDVPLSVRRKAAAYVAAAEASELDQPGLARELLASMREHGVQFVRLSGYLLSELQLTLLLEVGG